MSIEKGSLNKVLEFSKRFHEAALLHDWSACERILSERESYIASHWPDGNVTGPDEIKSAIVNQDMQSMEVLAGRAEEMKQRVKERHVGQKAQDAYGSGSQ